MAPRLAAFAFNYLQLWPRASPLTAWTPPARWSRIPGVTMSLVSLVWWHGRTLKPSPAPRAGAQPSRKAPVLLWASQLHCCVCFEKSRAAQRWGPLGNHLSPYALLTAHVLLARMLWCIFTWALRALCHVPALVTHGSVPAPGSHITVVKLHGPITWIGMCLLLFFILV